MSITLAKAHIRRVAENTYQCWTCAKQWSPRLTDDGLLPRLWWRCPNGCNGEINTRSYHRTIREDLCEYCSEIPGVVGKVVRAIDDLFPQRDPEKPEITARLRKQLLTLDACEDCTNQLLLIEGLR